MIKENKELLLKDLCARLPYGVKVRRYIYTTPTNSIESVELFGLGWLEELYNEEAEFKPYLFPISSMSVVQQKEFNKTLLVSSGGLLKVVNVTVETYDWLNKNHFDCRGLIEKGLAIDCTNLNIY